MKPWQYILHAIAFVVAFIIALPLIAYFKLTKKREALL